MDLATAEEEEVMAEVTEVHRNKPVSPEAEEILDSEAGIIVAEEVEGKLFLIYSICYFIISSEVRLTAWSNLIFIIILFF